MIILCTTPWLRPQIPPVMVDVLPGKHLARCLMWDKACRADQTRDQSDLVPVCWKVAPQLPIPASWEDGCPCRDSENPIAESKVEPRHSVDHCCHDKTEEGHHLCSYRVCPLTDTSLVCIQICLLREQVDEVWGVDTIDVVHRSSIIC